MSDKEELIPSNTAEPVEMPTKRKTGCPVGSRNCHYILVLLQLPICTCPYIILLVRHHPLLQSDPPASIEFWFAWAVSVISGVWQTGFTALNLALHRLNLPHTRPRRMMHLLDVYIWKTKARPCDAELATDPIKAAAREAARDAARLYVHIKFVGWSGMLLLCFASFCASLFVTDVNAAAGCMALQAVMVATMTIMEMLQLITPVSFCSKREKSRTVVNLLAAYMLSRYSPRANDDDGNCSYEIPDPQAAKRAANCGRGTYAKMTEIMYSELRESDPDKDYSLCCESDCGEASPLNSFSNALYGVLYPLQTSKQDWLRSTC